MNNTAQSTPTLLLNRQRKPHNTHAATLAAWRCGALLLALGAWHGGALAQAPMNAPVKPSFAIRGFNITGDNPLPAGETTRVLAPFLRTDASIETLQKATAALEAALKDSGYALYRVVLPPQEVGDTVNLQIVKFVLGKVTVEGLNRLDEANIRASLPELVEGQTPNFKTLAVQTTIANESQGKQVQIALKEAEDANKIDARIVVTEASPWNFALNLNNTGSVSTGRLRLTGSVGYSNLLNKDQQFVAAYTTSEKPSDVQQFGLTYRLPLYQLGGVLGATYTNSSVVGDFGSFTSTGAGETFALTYSHYLPPDGGYRSFASLGLGAQRYDPTNVSGTPVPGQQERTTAPLVVGYTGRMDTDTTTWGYNADFSVNLPWGAGNNLAAYQSEDPRITTSNFVVLRGGATYLSKLPSGWLWGVRTTFQLSPYALISGEEFGLGGIATVRGTGERPISGDSGIAATLEVSTPEWYPGLRFLAFTDAGYLNNHNPNGNPKPNYDHLASVGLGLRYWVGMVRFAVDYGYVVKGSVLANPLNNQIPRTGDSKTNFSMTVQF